MKEITTEKLRRFNLIMGGLHLVQGIAMLFLATNVIQKIGEFSPEISQFYLAFNPETRSLETASRVLFELPFGILVASFLFISAIAHALISIPKNLNAIYNADLEKGINKFRWFEYALSSSIMIVLIATLVRHLRYRFAHSDLHCECHHESLRARDGAAECGPFKR